MRYIHEHRDWPVFTLDGSRLALPLAETRFRQGRLLGRMEALSPASAREAEKRTLLNDLVATCALEGIKVARNSAPGQSGRDGSPAVRASGEYAMLRDALSGRDGLLTAARLDAWHAGMFRGAVASPAGLDIGPFPDSPEPHRWRSSRDGPKRITYGPLGWEKVQFEAPEAGRLAEEMRVFLAWFNFGKLPAGAESRGKEAAALLADPLIRAGIAHLWFITLHPYPDGSGRIARALTDLLLHRADAGSKRFYSLSEGMLKEREQYHAALKAAQDADKNGLDATGWLEWFLYCLGRAMLRAETLLAPVLKKDALRKKAEAPALNRRQRLVMEAMLGGGLKTVSSGSYARIAETSPDTALRDIRELISAGIFLQNPGRGRNTTYSLKGGKSL